ncbi:MAG TPA: dihydrofolate reductase family protein [Longimicrobiaceae bacterium]|nr:dihydrofolate reductase family protein [Longimicrobiaceae bacterium]
MRTVTFGVACSLDGFIAREHHGVDWLHWSDDVSAIMKDFWKTIDTVVMGRKTYEVALGMGTGAYPGVRNYVFSRTLKDVGEGTELVREDAADFVRRLKEEPGKGICVMGGGELARSLFEGAVVDEVGVNIHPVLLGTGIPLFPPTSRQTDLELAECRTLDGGCVYALYRVKR